MQKDKLSRQCLTKEWIVENSKGDRDDPIGKLKGTKVMVI